MKYLVLIYNDPELLNALPATEFDTTMRGCFDKADGAQAGTGSFSNPECCRRPSTAKSIRVRNGRQTTHDGPFAETKELLGGFNLIEAENMDEALRIAGGISVGSNGVRGGATARGHGRRAQACEAQRQRWSGVALKRDGAQSLSAVNATYSGSAAEREEGGIDVHDTSARRPCPPPRAAVRSHRAFRPRRAALRAR